MRTQSPATDQCMLTDRRTYCGMAAQQQELWRREGDAPSHPYPGNARETAAATACPTLQAGVRCQGEPCCCPSHQPQPHTRRQAMIGPTAPAAAAADNARQPGMILSTPRPGFAIPLRSAPCSDRQGNCHTHNQLMGWHLRGSAAKRATAVGFCTGNKECMVRPKVAHGPALALFHTCKLHNTTMRVTTPPCSKEMHAQPPTYQVLLEKVSMQLHLPLLVCSFRYV